MSYTSYLKRGVKSEQQLANEKSERIMKGVAIWCSFYRNNPQRFVKDYLNITLKTFQKFLIYAMMHNNHFMFWAARSAGKTWITALFCVVRCILFPGTKICVASSTRIQANEVLSKITDEFMKRYGWGSENLKREISDYTVGTNKAFIEFHNGSWIKVVTASDSARGNRANVLVLDEFRMIDKKTIDTVLKRFMGTPRQPLYLNKPEYNPNDNPDLLENNIEIYMSSAWFRSHWSYEKSEAYTANFIGGRKGYFVCALPYQIAIKEGLKKRVEIEDEMSESDFDQTIFDMEMGCIPFGNTDGAFFAFDDIIKRRKLKTAIYPPNFIPNYKTKIPDLVVNERRILSVDVALMASSKHKNDASSIIINSAIPTNNNNYKANIIYLENLEGLNTDELAMCVRRLFNQYKCTDLVIDTLGIGLGVFDQLIQDMVDYNTGEVYPALSCCNDKAMADRCKVDNAPKVIWSIKGNAQFNSEICLLLRSGFKNGNINLLIPEGDSEAVLKENIRGYDKLPDNSKFLYKAPYIQTTLLVYELVSLESETKGVNVKIVEKTGKRKDRYSSLAYNYWVMCQLEREKLRVRRNGFNIKDYAGSLRKLNKKPMMY